ncbi:oxidoreductase, short chain dehydrogenase/reductase family protein (macronuclear) [Tetrahymena thermophila SB210]|uniref:Oxidoreductase, short chain dehydrogenase/reductase family protein n=1 Tax=Tetrahymena thermophila (strain SB210) TaxID=312017 RepID=Q235Q4_TETTS|nr:oxidoreductase, short chain dehydrogenase/reductase family protein [Tetrahymena thermophila SB210]EAR92226.2 oxidoreductase, short chain dehydrogenase/reductase family protein [Tetrahymena thermophila SB210]|eukprot:XP_001012471.2 oxidoreductase, short chain dehydrogenase/reductase family protein [Tetrahymena thermophila SB210]
MAELVGVSYYRTKLCNLLFTEDIQGKLEKVGAKVVEVHPDTVRSNLIDDIIDDSKFYKLEFYLIYPIYWLFTKDTFQEAQTILYCDLEKHERLKEAKQLWDGSAVTLGFI